MTSAAKCHLQCHKKIWLKQNTYQHHVLNCDNHRWYSEWMVWLIHAHVTDIVMTNSDWKKIISASRALLWWSDASLKKMVRPSPAWWHCVQPTLGQSLGRDIFSQWSSQWSWEVCGACERFQERKWACFVALFDPTDNQNSICWESMLILLLDTTRQVYSKNVAIIADNNVVTKWVIKSWLLI